MKLKHIVKWISILLTCMLCWNCFPKTTFFTEALTEQSTQKDSGIDYTESIKTIQNPGMGYTSTLWYKCKPNDTPIYDRAGSLVLMFIDIGAFSSGANGTTAEDGTYTEGTDYDLDDTFFTNVRATFENCRKNGCMIAVRFRYDANGKTNPEPATFEKMLSHIQQIQDNGLLEDYKDILAFVESGFVGAWGEQHSGKYTSLEDKAKLLDTMLKVVPKEVPVTVRTPNTFAKWAGIPVKNLDTYTAEPGSDADRVGLYNDGYMGSDSDLGTFSNRVIETAWMHQQMTHTYYGGEFSGNLDWAKKYTTYLPENAIPEMYYTHLSYINANIYQLYKDYTFGEAYDVEGVDNSAYYGQTVFQFIRDHLGYRFVLRKSSLDSNVQQGDKLHFQFSIENTGFANPIQKQKAEVILMKDGDYICTKVDLDSRKWKSCTTTDIPITVQLPGDLEIGDWDVYLRLSVGNEGIQDGQLRTVQFANNGTWNAALGANYLGSTTIDSSDQTNSYQEHCFYQVNENNEQSTMKSDGSRYTIRGKMIIDGQKSSQSEWQGTDCYGTEDERSIYLSNDDQYLYVMAEIPQNATSPVYNLKLTNETTGHSFWIYYMSNGYVYFNNGSYNGCVQKHDENVVEFKIPFGSMMELEPGVVLSSVRIFVQDSANEWKNLGDISSTQYTITNQFYSDSACRTIELQENESFQMHVLVSLQHASYQWLFNDTPIEGATNSTYQIEKASSDSVGTYSVRVTSDSGLERIIPITIVHAVHASTLIGDINQDSAVDLADIVWLQAYLIGTREATTSFWNTADMNQDTIVNGFDLSWLKRTVLDTK